MSTKLSFNQFYEKLISYFQAESYINRLSLGLLAYNILMEIVNVFNHGKVPYAQYIWIFITLFAISSLIATFHGYLHLWILTTNVDKLNIHIEKKESKLYHQISLLEQRRQIFLNQEINDDKNINKINDQLKILQQRLTMLHQVFPNI